MSFRLYVANVHDDPAAVRQTLDAADYAMLNEVRTRATRAIRALASVWAWFIPKGAARQNVHVWRTAKFAVAKASIVRRITAGGRRGLAGTDASLKMKRRYAKRRLGPSRYAVVRLVRELSTGLPVLMVCVHLPARTQTSERWRWAVMRLTMRLLRRLLLACEKRWPGVPIILAGDMNLKDPSDLLLGTGWKAVHTLPDMGGRRYTQIHTKGAVSISHVSEEHTASDHDAVRCTVTLHAA